MPLNPRVDRQQRGPALPGCGTLACHGCWDMQGHLGRSCRGQAKSGTLGMLTCCSPKAPPCDGAAQQKGNAVRWPHPSVTFLWGGTPCHACCTGRLGSAGQPCAWLLGLPGREEYIVAERDASPSQHLQLAHRISEGRARLGSWLLCSSPTRDSCMDRCPFGWGGNPRALGST